ncbi:MAG: tetratricopeptide repeat protein [Tannerellaceae bacterium]|jgi:tetratricopeptide (TPR) repeat protein|nr:tetratricopeptide repeat protein [Tannerellaceae bacterium]
MKRLLFIIVLCTAVTAAFAQKKAVSEAQSIAKSTNANFNEARELIKGALANAETKDDPKSWYVAGYIEDQQFSAERMKQLLGQQPNEAVMYSALLNVLPFFEKSYELDQLPDAKGKVKPKHTKDIKGILGADHIYYINAGAFYFNERNYQKAYESFDQYVQIANHAMFAGEKTAARDSNFMLAQYYAAVAAAQLNNHDLAIAALKRASGTDYNTNEVYQYLFGEYQALQDTVNMEKTLEEGLAKLPSEQFFLLNLINIYIYTNRLDQAIDFLNKAIAQTPDNANLFNVLGIVYEQSKDEERAMSNFSKALSIEPDNADIQGNMGRIYFNRAFNKQNEANAISDNKVYQEEVQKAKDLFRQALPFYEKAHKLKPEEREYMVALRGIYYNLNMSDELTAIEAKMGL